MNGLVRAGACLALVLVSSLAHGQLIDRRVAGKAREFKSEWPLKHPKGAAACPPYDLITIAQMLDALEEGVMDDGTVVVKRPDVWSQARMTKFRREFEGELRGDVTKFEAVLSARVARTDEAAFSNVAQLGQSLGNTATATPATTGTPVTVPTAAINLFPTAGTDATGIAATGVQKLLNSAGAFQGVDTSNFGKGKLGLEPTVFLDEKKRYLDHLHEIRRVNLGDDNADRPGYSLYLVRIPASIQPGAKTRNGHGAVLSMTVRPDFGPQFVRKAFREFVVSDLVNELTPLVFRLAGEKPETLSQYLDAKQALHGVESSASPTGDAQANNTRDAVLKSLHSYSAKFMIAKPRGTGDAGTKVAQPHFATARTSAARVPTKTYGLPPSEMIDAYLFDNLAELALRSLSLSDWKNPRALDIRTMLAQEAEAAYDFMPHIAPFVPQIGEALHTRDYGKLDGLCSQLVLALPGDAAENLGKRRRNVRAILCYAIAVDAALLDEQIRKDAKTEAACDTELGPLYVPEPDAETCAAFERYIKAKWPMLTFALDPVTDQQNIADALSLRRDMQLAVAYAFASGRTNFSNATKFRRQLEQDSEAIALNRTVTAFAHGNESFGWRFSPRYQNQPPEATNVASFFNLLVSNGPGRNYRVRNSKLEAGQRELTAVIVMPSFLQHIRFEVVGNWFNLVRPDNLTIPTARMLWLGQRLMALRQAATQLCAAPGYRAGDVQRILARIDQLEAMLPMQTEVTSIPYEASQGGFALFTGGNVALAPELVGYEGLDQPQLQTNPAAISIYLVGRNFSVQETKVLVGGRLLDDIPSIVSTTKDGSTTTVATPSAVPNIQVLSREVLAVSVPAEALRSARKDGTDAVEIAVATPNGVSNRLLIPLSAPAPAAAATPAKASSGLNWKNPKETVELMVGLDSADQVVALSAKPTGLPIIATLPSMPPAPLAFDKLEFALTLVNKDKPGAKREFAGKLAPVKGVPVSADLASATLVEALRKEVAAKLKPSEFAEAFDGTLSATAFFGAAKIALDDTLPVKAKIYRIPDCVVPATPAPVPLPVAPAVPTAPVPMDHVERRAPEALPARPPLDRETSDSRRGALPTRRRPATNPAGGRVGLAN